MLLLIVFKADRLSRNALEYPVVIDRFRRIGCQVWSVKDAPGGKLLALDTQMDKFVRFLEGWQAETESQNTSIRVSEAMQQLARQGRWSGGPVPYGYRLNEGRRPKSDLPALVIDPEQAEVIRRMAGLYLDQRMGCLRIARELNRLLVPHPSGRPWDDQRVRRILQNPLIAGLPAYGRNRASGRHFSRKNPYDLDQFIVPRDPSGNLRPAAHYQILPLDRWLQLLAAMQTARGDAPRRHMLTARQRGAGALLTGLLYCGHCGARLSADANTYKNRRADGTVAAGRRLYYLCQTHLHQGRRYCEGQRTYGCKRLEQVVTHQLEMLLSLLDRQELASMLRTHAHPPNGEQLRLAEAELKKADRVLEGWLARMDAYLADPEASPFTEEMLIGKICEARQRRESLAANLNRLEPGREPARTAVLPQSWWQSFQEVGKEEQKLLLRELVDRIIVRREGVEIRFAVPLDSLGLAHATPLTGQSPSRP